MERVHIIMNFLQDYDFMTKVALKDAYFGIPLQKDTKKFIQFRETLTFLLQNFNFVINLKKF